MKDKVTMWLCLNSEKVYRWSILFWAICISMVFMIGSLGNDDIINIVGICLTEIGILIYGTYMIFNDGKPVSSKSIDEKLEYKITCIEYSATIDDLLVEYKEAGYKDYDYMVGLAAAFNDAIDVKSDIVVIEHIYSRLYKLLIWDGYEHCKAAYEPKPDNTGDSVRVENMEIKDGDKVGKIKGKKPNFAQKQALNDHCKSEEEAMLYLYQKDVTKQADGSKNLNSNIEKITYWQFVNRETGELKYIPSTR